jgi:hypothetical protein
MVGFGMCGWQDEGSKPLGMAASNFFPWMDPNPTFLWGPARLMPSLAETRVRIELAANHPLICGAIARLVRRVHGPTRLLVPVCGLQDDKLHSWVQPTQRNQRRVQKATTPDQVWDVSIENCPQSTLSSSSLSFVLYFSQSSPRPRSRRENRPGLGICQVPDLLSIAFIEVPVSASTSRTNDNDDDTYRQPYSNLPARILTLDQLQSLRCSEPPIPCAVSSDDAVTKALAL